MKKKTTTDTTDLMERPASATAIRSETVLSRLPVHNLSKSGPIKISISRTDANGIVSLLWEVSPNDRIGQPGQLAYKLDSLVINRRIDDDRNAARRDGSRSLSQRLKLGSLNDVLRELGITLSGANRASVRKALQQSAATFIRAKLSYKTTNGDERLLDAFFNRYNVIFTGERLSDKEVADSIYIILTEPYWEVLNSAPFRPLDYDYLKELPPAPQRFYEVISYRIYAALQNGYPTARMSYSEYCTYSAQSRFHEYPRFKNQMWRIHQPHLKSGYLESVAYEETVDDTGNIDWMMVYVPGPKAVAEYRAFSRKHPKPTPNDRNKKRRQNMRSGSKAPQRDLTPPLGDEAKQFCDELVASGLAAGWAREYVRQLDQGGLEEAQHVVDYWLATGPEKRWENPAGMLRRLLEIQVAEGLPILSRYPSRKARAVADENKQRNEARVNAEAQRYLDERRELDRRIDTALAALTKEARRVLERKADEACLKIKGFSSWAPNARERERMRHLRRLVMQSFARDV